MADDRPPYPLEQKTTAQYAPQLAAPITGAAVFICSDDSLIVGDRLRGNLALDRIMQCPDREASLTPDHAGSNHFERENWIARSRYSPSVLRGGSFTSAVREAGARGRSNRPCHRLHRDRRDPLSAAPRSPSAPVRRNPYRSER